MNIELSLLELNDLYYVVSKGVEKHKEYVEIAKRTTPELEKYFPKETGSTYYPVVINPELMNAINNQPL